VWPLVKAPIELDQLTGSPLATQRWQPPRFQLHQVRAYIVLTRIPLIIRLPPPWRSAPLPTLLPKHPLYYYTIGASPGILKIIIFRFQSPILLLSKQFSGEGNTKTRINNTPSHHSNHGRLGAFEPSSLPSHHRWLALLLAHS
jgi:hypothetical protein